MAMINGRAVRPAKIPYPIAKVVVWLARPPGASESFPREVARRLDALFPNRNIRPYFSEPLTFQAPPPPDLWELDDYLAMDASHREAERLAAELRQGGDVRNAYVEAAPARPPGAPTETARTLLQGYLNAAPRGVDARFAWTQPIANRVGFVDIEMGWNLNHDDLKGLGIPPPSGQNLFYKGHGASVLGEVVAADNGVGVVGIAFGNGVKLVSQWRTATNFSTGQAIVAAMGQMQPGDVLLLEAQVERTVDRRIAEVPVEVEDATFAAIRKAVDFGIVVIEPAANGKSVLDDYRNNQGVAVLGRNAAGPGAHDSGAIMVAASTATTPYAPDPTSNRGSRVDCFAWGSGIQTCADGEHASSQGANSSFMPQFGGTSGASAIVAGAALLLQAVAKGKADRHLPPGDVRRLFSDPALNTKSAGGIADGIGVMPNLRAIIEQQFPAPP